MTRSSAAEPAVADKSEKWPSLKATWGGSGDAKSEDVATPRAAASGRLPAGSGTGRASSAATSSRTSGQVFFTPYPNSVALAHLSIPFYKAPRR